MQLKSNETEAANRAEATALLIRAGFRVYRPEADAYGEDLVIRTPNGELQPVQLKSRPTVNQSLYAGLWMLFPNPNKPVHAREWYLVEHRKLFEWVKAKHGHAPKWNDAWSYPHASAALLTFLEPHSDKHWAQWNTLSKA